VVATENKGHDVVDRCRIAIEWIGSVALHVARLACPRITLEDLEPVEAVDDAATIESRSA
jgi:hypothetical protein